MWPTVLGAAAMHDAGMDHGTAPEPGPGAVGPLPQAFAHRDSAHHRPLLDALDAGFTAVEADLWLRDGQLLIGHDEVDLNPSRTLASTYLRPLAELSRTAALPTADGTPLTLVLDAKTAARPTWRALERELGGFGDVLTRWTRDGVTPGAATVLVSGHRARRLMATRSDRLAGYDGRPPDLSRRWPFAPPPVELVPMVSADWTKAVGWDGVGPVPRRIRRRVTGIVATAHRQGRTVRFWATPDEPGPPREAVWSLLLDLGVDHLNTDDLAGLARFLHRGGPTPDR